MSEKIQISAFVSTSTKEKLEAYARATGTKKAFFIESALLHHLSALEELPADIVLPVRLVATRASGIKIADRLSETRKPTPALVELLREAE